MHIPPTVVNCAATLMALPDVEFLLILRSTNGSATMGSMDLSVGRDILQQKLSSPENVSVLREPADMFQDQDPGPVLPEDVRQEGGRCVGDGLRPDLHQSLQEARVGGETWAQAEGEGEILPCPAVEPEQDILQLAGSDRQKRKVPTMEDDSEDEFVGSSPKQPHAKGNLTLWQPLPDLETEYSKLKQAAKKTFANRLLKSVKPPGIRLGGKVKAKHFTHWY